jgi:hypothetical protein
MTLRFEFDFSQLEKMALSMGAAADQIPFALSMALNRATDITRNLLVRHTWPSSGIKVRNPAFINAALRTQEARATKGSLVTEIYDRFAASGRDAGHLMKQAKGGVRIPRGSKLAIPVSSLKSGRGVPNRLKPKVLGDKAVRKGDLLYVKERGRLKLVYVLKPATKIPKRVPFYEDYEASMSREMQRLLPLAVRHAMATRRR